MVTSVRRAAALVATSLLAVTGCGNDAPVEAPTTTQALGVDLSDLAPRAGYAIFTSTDDACRVLEGDGLLEPVPAPSVLRLWVLAALGRAVTQRRILWETPITIRDDLRSTPGGTAYSYPAGTQVSVAELARLMVAEADDTATDHLIDALGRSTLDDIVRKLAPDGALRSLPALTTAEARRLTVVDPALGREYATLDAVGRSEALTTLSDRAPWPGPGGPTAIDVDPDQPVLIDEVGWFASGRDLCRVMVDLARLARLPGPTGLDELLAELPRLPTESEAPWSDSWLDRSEQPGLLTLTYRLVQEDDERVVVIALSDPAAPLPDDIESDPRFDEILDAARP